jgi:hypothetical protein
LRRFLHHFVSDRFWRTAGAFSKTTIFFKLQAGVSFVSSAPPPRLHRTTPRPRPTPAAPEFDHLKSLYSVRVRAWYQTTCVTENYSRNSKLTVLSWISGWLTSRHFGRGAQVPRLVVMTVALPCGDGAARRRTSALWHAQRRR